MNRYAIIGFPLRHTMSPPIHERLFRLSGREDFCYDVLELPPERLPLERERLASLCGYNITIPHKVAVIDFCDRLDESAKRYMSVNCVANKDGVHTGYNTDCIGFTRAIEEAGLSLCSRVLQIGCGGVGRMMAIETLRLGGSLTLAILRGQEQTADPVREYAEKNGSADRLSVVYTDEICGEFDLLTNATPVGMFPKVDGCPVSDEVIASVGAVFDVIYNPVKTTLMKKAAAMGKPAFGGMGMLVWQAVIAHEIWDNASYEKADIEALIADSERQVEENFR